LIQASIPFDRQEKACLVWRKQEPTGQQQEPTDRSGKSSQQEQPQIYKLAKLIKYFRLEV
jgi:hypothetical protein